ncbi:MAG: type II secretion system major pseudopilin GspG [Verrucomicrobia bacterium]|nr:type II secretion system major pseudopilin GspG [Verrucomicrobiota bacterium]
MRLRLDKRGGFTLIEMLLVIVIIGMLVTLVGVNVVKRSGEAKGTAARAQIVLYKTALSTYNLDAGVYPTSDQGLQALIAVPNPPPAKWTGPYLDPAIIKPDPWNRPFIYQCPPQQNPDPDGFDLYSVGPDGQPGTEDDVVSWK